MNRKLLIAALGLTLTTGVQAQQPFCISYQQRPMATDAVTFCQSQLPDACAGSTYVVIGERTDKHGILHQRMQQYVDGLKVDGVQMILHSRDGRVLSFNGQIISSQMLTEADARQLRRAPMMAPQALERAGLCRELSEQAELVLCVHDGSLHKAYRVVQGSTLYRIDAMTGEVLSQQSLWQSLDDETPVQATVETMLSGQRTIDCAQLADGTYTLTDAARNLKTLNASYQIIFDATGMGSGQQSNYEAYVPWDMYVASIEEKLPYINTWVNNVEQGSERFISQSANWADEPFNRQLDSLMVDYSDMLKKYDFTHISMQLIHANDTVRTDTVQYSPDDFPRQKTLHLTQPIVYQSGEYWQAQVVLLGGSKSPIPSFSFGVIICADQTACTQYSVPDNEEDEEIHNLRIKVSSYIDGIYTFNSFRGVQPALDAHWGMERVLDYYRDVHDYNSFDGKGTPVRCFINSEVARSANANALSVSGLDYGTMVFGLGMECIGPNIEYIYKPMVYLDVMCHEFTHLVAFGLNGGGIDTDAMALNESFADIMGLTVSNWAKGTDIWQIAPGSTNGDCVRDFVNPNAMRAPECYGDSLYQSFDHKPIYDPHQNANVQNHMFYLLVKGGEGVNSLGQDYSVTAMDQRQAEDLAFSVLVDHTCPGMMYEDCAKVWITTAGDIYGQGSAQQRSVTQAWHAVGLAKDVPLSIQTVNDAQSDASAVAISMRGGRIVISRNGRSYDVMGHQN